MKLLNGCLRIIILFISYDKRFQLNPEDPNLQKNKGHFFKKLNRLDEALEWLF